MTRLAAPLLAVLVLAGCAAALHPGQAVLDFSIPPAQLYRATLIEVDGEPVSASLNQSSFWVEAGEHEILVSAVLSDPTKIGVLPQPSQRGQGRTTIVAEAGMRYRIAAESTDRRGDWRPVVWKVEEL